MYIIHNLSDTDTATSKVQRLNRYQQKKRATI